MDAEVKRQLEEIHALTRENHRILRAMRRDHWIGLVFSVIFWAIVVIAPLVLFQQYVQPLIQQYAANPQSASSFFMPSPSEIQQLIDTYKGQLQQNSAN